MKRTVDKIVHNNTLLGIIIYNSFEKEGIEFFTPDHFSQQLAYMKRPRNYSIPPHVHNPVPREVTLTNEVLFIKSGRMRIDFYNDQHAYIESRVVVSGDVILLSHGGHGFEMLEETEIIEVKQGPYAGEKDKTRFEAVNENKIKIV